MGTVPRAVQSTAYQAALATQGIKRYKLGAVLYDRKGRIINAKGNQRKTHPKLLRYSDHPFLHAESHCILAHGLDNCEGLDLFVCRIGRSGSFRLAKPCDSCSRLIQDVGLRSVWYTTDEGNIIAYTP